LEGTGLLERIRSEVRRRVAGNPPSHDWLHVERVYSLCMRLCEGEGGDREVLGAAALLHDVARSTAGERLGGDHAERSAEAAEEVLRALGFPAHKIGSVLYAIRSHRFSAGVKPESAEAVILQDADRLESIGAIGVARAFSYGGAMGLPMYEAPGGYSTITHFHQKLLRVKDSLNTESARRIAEQRHEFTRLFLERFLREVSGEA